MSTQAPSRTSAACDLYARGQKFAQAEVANAEAEANVRPRGTVSRIGFLLHHLGEAICAEHVRRIEAEAEATTAKGWDEHLDWVREQLASSIERSLDRPVCQYTERRLEPNLNRHEHRAEIEEGEPIIPTFEFDVEVETRVLPWLDGPDPEILYTVTARCVLERVDGDEAVYLCHLV